MFLGKLTDKILDVFASFFLKLFVQRPPRSVVDELQNMLEDKDFELRSFDELLFKTAIYEDEPHKLVFILKRYVRAERYRSSKGQEMWGLPRRNVGAEPKEGILYGSLGTKVLLSVAVLGVALGLFLPIVPSLSSRVLLSTYPPYDCHSEPGSVLPGLCYPQNFSMDLPYPVRVSLMINCMMVEPYGEDRYSSGSCLHYLSRDEAQDIGVFDYPGRGAFRSDMLSVLDDRLTVDAVRQRYIKYRTLDLY